MIGKVFRIAHRKWRGIGEIPLSGLALTDDYQAFDAEQRFQVGQLHAEEASECIAGLVLQGVKKPFECSAFGRTCTPEKPLGAPMVSSEGACAAYYLYHRSAEELR